MCPVTRKSFVTCTTMTSIHISACRVLMTSIIPVTLIDILRELPWKRTDWLMVRSWSIFIFLHHFFIWRELFPNIGLDSHSGVAELHRSNFNGNCLKSNRAWNIYHEYRNFFTAKFLFLAYQFFKPRRFTKSGCELRQMATPDANTKYRRIINVTIATYILNTAC